jgi:hypothetical protein
MTLVEASTFVVKCAKNLQGIKSTDPRLDRLLMEMSVAEAELMDAFAREPGTTPLHSHCGEVLEAWADFGRANVNDRHEFMALLNRLRNLQLSLELAVAAHTPCPPSELPPVAPSPSESSATNTSTT